MSDIDAERKTVRKYLVRLHHILSTQFNKGELLLLCRRLELDYDALPGESRVDKVKGLLVFLVRRARIPEMVDIGKQLRPDLDWNGRLDEIQQILSTSQTPPQRIPGKSRVFAGASHRRRGNPGTEGSSLLGKLLFSLLIVIVVGWMLVVVTAWVSQTALPGEPLYRIKQLTENGRRLLATSPRQRAALELKFAARRLEELRLCAQEGV